LDHVHCLFLMHEIQKKEKKTSVHSQNPDGEISIQTNGCIWDSNHGVGKSLQQSTCANAAQAGQMQGADHGYQAGSCTV
jgi:hypothetical protein